MKKIYVYVPKQAVAMSITLIKELCWVATHYAAEQQGVTCNPSHVVQLISEDGHPVRCFSGNSLSVDLSMQDIDTADAFFVGAFWGHPHSILPHCEGLLRALPALHQQRIPITAVSNGPVFLAAAGLLDHKATTLYPPAAESFRALFPTVSLQLERAITRVDNLYCANGIASGCDVAVSIIDALYGSDIAQRISQEFLLGFQRSYTIANTHFDGQKYHKDRQVLKAQQWLEQHFQQSVTLQSLATSLGMSPRNFSRRFKSATGDSPSHYLQRIRVATAKELLKDSRLTIAEIAYQVGFSDVSYFSRTFAQHTQLQPSGYRDTLHLPDQPSHRSNVKGVE